ncbi:MAG TPA: prepilin-type N-terminal cleavage/methylation domain-containing protein, partial [Campylobacterales bacterium]|nr:prepilin-type N-terminal cleavage/methylation domain-containing protein [Campylobacterales bacterium]
MKKGFKKGFTLVEMMIVVAIIAILAGVAIPQYTKYVRKSEAVEAVGFLKQIVDAESTYYASHNKFYVNTKATDKMQKTIEVLSLDNIRGKFEYGVATDGNATILVRANKPGETNYIYMFFPSDNNSSINGYVADEWDNTVFTS